MLRHTIPLETSVAFNNNSTIYKVTDYTEVLGPCSPDCNLDHDCYSEAYITVREEKRTAFPLSQLRHIFNPITHCGREATVAEKTPVEV